MNDQPTAPNLDPTAAGEAIEQAVLNARTRDVLGPRTSWFYARVVGFVLGGLVIVVSVLWGLTTMIDLQHTANAQAEDLATQTADVKALVEFVAGVDSPEAQEATARMLERVLDHADCDNRAALDDLVKGMEAEGLVAAGAINMPCAVEPGPLTDGGANLVPQAGGDSGG